MSNEPHTTELPSKIALRAVRRHHRQRLRAHRRFHWGRDISREHPRSLAGVVDTPTPCSCWMCGNRRRYFGERTLQERRVRQESRLS